MTRVAPHALVIAGTLSVVCLTTGRANAGGPDDATKEAARQAYDRGAAAYDAGDYARAMAELSRADELFPSDIALELALKAAVKGDDARTAVVLANRADQRSKGGSLGAAVAAARTKMAGRTGTVSVACPGRAACTAKIDDKDLPAGEAYVVLVGQHRVVIEGGGAPREAYDVRVDPDATLVVKAQPPPAVPPPAGPPRAREQPPESPRSGISPVWFWFGAGLTAVVGGVAIASGLDTRAKHDDFAAHPSADAQQAGLDAQLRTNLLAGGAGLAGVVTAVVGLVFVQWSSPASSSTANATNAMNAKAVF
jgi:hypothetical protein